MMKRLLKDLPVAQPRLALRSARPAATTTGGAGGPGPAAVSMPAPATAPDLAADQLVEARARAEKAGYDEGYRRGTAQARADLEAEWRKLERLCAALTEAQQQQAYQATDLAAEFAYAVTCRVLGQQAVAADSVRGAAQAVLEQALETGSVLRVHPQDLPLLEALVARHPGLTVRADAAVMLGGCVLEHAQGSLDARLETQLDELKRAVLAWRLQEAR